MLNTQLKNVICPYCGYKLPTTFTSTSECKEILIKCKGRQCGRLFSLIIKKGIQRNLNPDEDTVRAFKAVFGVDYKKHIFDTFGVDLNN